MTNTMTDALKTILAQSPAAGREAMQTLRALEVGSPMLQHRYNRTIEVALGDAAAKFTVAERKLITQFVVSTDRDTRANMVTVRLSGDELAQIDRAAGDTSRSRYIRAKLGFD